MFDFLTEEKKPLVPEVVHHGPNGKSLKRMTRRQVIQDILDVYEEENGKDLIRLHMKADPKGFFEIIKKFIPNQMSLDANEMLNIRMIDRFGNELEISPTSVEGDNTAPPTPHRDPPNVRQKDPPRITLHERFGADHQPDETATCSSPEFDFTLK